MDRVTNLNIQKVLWHTKLNETVIQPMRLVGNTLFVVSRAGDIRSKHSKLHALSISNGLPKWNYEFQYALISGLQSYLLAESQEEIVIVATSSSDLLQGRGHLLALDQAGNKIWERREKKSHYMAPLVNNHKLYVFAGTRELIVIDLEGINPSNNYRKERNISLNINASSSPLAIQDNIVYIPCKSPEMLALENNGTVHWHFKYNLGNRDWLDKTPLVSNNNIYTVSRLGTIFSLDRSNGNLRWQQSVDKGHIFSEMSIAEDYLLLGTSNGLIALDVKNGEIVWDFNTKRPVSAKPIIQENIVYVTCEDHTLYGLNLHDGKPIWQFELKRRVEIPSINSQVGVLVSDRGGNVYAIEPPFIKPLTPPSVVLNEDLLTTDSCKEAEEYEANREYKLAAELWYKCGELERAANLYDKAECWPDCAKLWQQLNRLGKSASALHKYAKLLSSQNIEDEKKAKAWENATVAYSRTSQKKERLFCQREVAKYRNEPILELTIEPNALSLTSWVDLPVKVFNDGFSLAQNVSVKLVEDQTRFAYELDRTETSPSIKPGEEYEFFPKVYPQQSGEQVPLILTVSYMDTKGQVHNIEKLWTIEVVDNAVNPTKTKPWPDGFDHIKFYEYITEHFNTEELKHIITFDFSWYEDDFSNQRSVMTKELMACALRSNQLEKLIKICNRERPQAPWRR